MQAQITAMQAVIAQLQADAVTSQAAVAAAQATAAAAQAAAAAVPAGGAPAAPIDVAAIAAAVAGARRPPDHSRDLDYFDSVSLDETPVPMRADDFLIAANLQFANKNTPVGDRVKLIVPKLKGKALNTFKAFTNAAGNVNDAQTTTWVEFETLFKTLIPNDLAESDKIEAEYAKIVQTGSAEKFTELYKHLVGRILRNTESMTLHNEKTLRTSFLKKLKPTVQLHFDCSKLTSLEDAYAEAIRADALVYNSQLQEKAASAPRTPFRTPNPSRASTPAPPPAVLALLAALGVDCDTFQVPTGSCPPKGP